MSVSHGSTALHTEDRSPAALTDLSAALVWDPTAQSAPPAAPVVRSGVPTGDTLGEISAFTAEMAQLGPVDWSGASDRELHARTVQAGVVRWAWAARIAELRSFAVQDGDAFNSASERGFWDFVRGGPFLRRGGLVLTPGGDLRAVWRQEPGARIGLQFLGGGMVQYVIFKRRSGAGQISRVAGRDDFEGVRRQIRAFDLQSLIYS